MTISERLHNAASRILAGDESVAAAQDLESVLLDEYLDDERTSALLEGLALYAPGSGAPYVKAPELRDLIAAALEQLGRANDGDHPCG